jgi:hypothetical protein
VLTIEAGTLDVTGAGTDRTLQLNANTEWTGGSITAGALAIIDNAAGRTFRIGATSPTLGTAGSQFNNSGLVVRSGSTGVATLRGTFTNLATGTVDVRTGTLHFETALANLNSGVLTGGTYVVASILRLPN